MHAVGVLLTAMVLSKIVARFGLRRLVILALLLAAAVLVAFPALPFPRLWFVLRVLLGAPSEVLRSVRNLDE